MSIYFPNPFGLTERECVDFCIENGDYCTIHEAIRYKYQRGWLTLEEQWELLKSPDNSVIVRDEY
jgi:hypothetical protein